MVRNGKVRRKVLVAVTTAADACLRGVARFARLQGWHLVTDMMLTGTFPRGWKGDGIIALAPYRTEVVGHILGSGAPCVNITVSADPTPFPAVRADDAAVGRVAAEYLLGRAYRRFAWAPFIGDQINRERFVGFASRLAAHGCLCETLPAMHRRIGGYWHDDWADYRSELLARLTQLPRSTAIFAANDCVAAEIVEACRELDISVPDEVAVLGVGNDPGVCTSASVPLSSVDLDLEEMAFRAAEALDELMRGGSVPEVIPMLPKRVITRLSTDTCAVSDAHVARALGYIAEHFPEPELGIAGVAEAVGISRRHLERSFRRETGNTIHEFIIKRRMQEASRMLRTHPRAKVGAIAELVGFGAAGSFFRTFRRYFGESPSVHRQSSSRATDVIAGIGESTRASA
jgi:LacI family transcriptional regulator